MRAGPSIFDVTPDMLSFYGPGNRKILEKGLFRFYIGADSETENLCEWMLI